MDADLRHWFRECLAEGMDHAEINALHTITMGDLRRAVYPATTPTKNQRRILRYWADGLTVEQVARRVGKTGRNVQATISYVRIYRGLPVAYRFARTVNIKPVAFKNGYKFERRRNGNRHDAKTVSVDMAKPGAETAALAIRVGRGAFVPVLVRRA